MKWFLMLLMFLMACVHQAPDPSIVIAVESYDYAEDAWTPVATAFSTTSPEGIWTARHVAEHKDVRFCSQDSRCVYPTEVLVGIGPDQDWAFYPVEPPGGVKQFKVIRKPVLGQEMWSWGYGNMTLTLNHGHVSRLEDYGFVIDARVVPGNSGGPAFDGNEVYGIVSAISVIPYGLFGQLDTHDGMIVSLAGAVDQIKNEEYQVWSSGICLSQ